MKTYILPFLRRFPAGHPQAGLHTMFMANINLSKIRARDNRNARLDCCGKIHTLRSNYEEWLPRIHEVQTGEAELSLCYVNEFGENIEFRRLTFLDGIGIECVLDFPNHAQISAPDDPNKRQLVYLDELAENEGLCREDLLSWFRADGTPWGGGRKLALIHFTPFRYMEVADILSKHSNMIWLCHKHEYYPTLHLMIDKISAIRTKDQQTVIRYKYEDYLVRESKSAIEAAIAVQRAKQTA